MFDQVAVDNDLKHITPTTGRKLLDYRVGYGFPEQTGDAIVQVGSRLHLLRPTGTLSPVCLDPCLPKRPLLSPGQP